MSKQEIDYTLYLVADPSVVPKGSTFLGQIEEALKGGVSVVQLREKDTETGQFLGQAQKVKALAKKYDVPLIINDRIDVAMAIDADGVHIGQDDMPLANARRILGSSKIIGVSVQTEKEAVAAVKGGADYLGIGAVYATSTKKIKHEPLGISGVQKILEAIAKNPIPTVAIGGINLDNARSLVEESQTKCFLTLDGLAIVSAIMAASKPKEVCEELITHIDDGKNSSVNLIRRIFDNFETTVSKVRKTTPLIHHITNAVVMNDSANITLAVGASPFMSAAPSEMKEIAKMSDGLLLNIGTMDNIDVMLQAIDGSRAKGTPILLDPVGVGVTTARKQAVARLVDRGGISVIKGNTGEILALAGIKGKSRGVDAVGSISESVAMESVKSVARQYDCVVVMTGPHDYISDGDRVVIIENGDPMLTLITGSGCMAGSIITSFLAANRDDAMLATVSGLLLYAIAAQIAASRIQVSGPGSFKSALIDQVYSVSRFPKSMRHYARLRSPGSTTPTPLVPNSPSK